MDTAKVLICVLTTVGLALVYSIRALIAKRRKIKYNIQPSGSSIIVRLPKYSSALMLITILFLLCCFLWLNALADFKEIIALDIVMICAMAVLVFVHIIFERLTIAVTDDRIIYTPFFGHTAEFRFLDIKYIQYKYFIGSNWFAVIGQDDSKLFNLYPKFIGTNRFIDKAKELGIEIKYTSEY